MKWRWGRGEGFSQYDLGAPTSATTYALCVYDSSNGTDQLVTEMQINPNAMWSSKDPSGWIYTDNTGSQDGVMKAVLKAGGLNKSKVRVVARGMNVPIPLPLGGETFLTRPASYHAVVQ
jgi:hypothetical protein